MVVASVVGAAVVLAGSVVAVEVVEATVSDVASSPPLWQAAAVSVSAAQSRTIDRWARNTGECLLAAAQILRNARR